MVSGASLTIEDGVTVYNNTAGLSGGGVYVSASSLLRIAGTGEHEDVMIYNNTALDGDGGGVVFANLDFNANPVVDLMGVTISGNKAYGNGLGGGIAVFGAVRVDADMFTWVTGNWQAAPAPASPPYLLGVFLDPNVLATSTFFLNAQVYNNYQF